ncbi:response regulator receiver domain-containing protein [Haloactinospora alba]|uniref:Response regulator receiver domain-containing protein n=1 Tax=Haloactinospora alba TaxID=405555 RepID=A0A543NE71_9ACTN|nr:response regulator [Haloactinospora alba]TQN27873.1 response regulator receiver domain-containing protein [Haloactinospora alba]TQN30148.1 response regulator receiver domain-containing protein [Haloactinospora alba]
MPESLWVELASALPTLLWVVFASVVFLSLRRPLLNRIVPHIAEIKGPGLEITLKDAEQLIEKADEDTTGGESHSAEPDTVKQRRSAVNRLEHAAVYLRSGRILWVDDIPSNNSALTRLFTEMDMRVDQATTTGEALELLYRYSYDLVISDIERHGDPGAGIDMVREFHRAGIRVPVIYHAAKFDPRLGVDPMVFAGTNSPSHVLNYVIDIMERRRLGDAMLPFHNR